MLILNVESYEGSYSKIYQDHIPCSFAYKPICVDDKFSKWIIAFEFIDEILKEYQYCKKVRNKTLQQKFDHKWRRRTTISIK